MIGDFKIVDFYEYCHHCKYRDLNRDLNPDQEPCATCITVSARQDSRRPEKWEGRNDPD